MSSPVLSAGGRVRRVAFAAMGTTLTLLGVGAGERRFAEGLEHARRCSAAWEARFSRFRPDSELARLNGSAGRPVPVSTEMLALLALAADGVRRTDGRFDPSILPALEVAGYDRDLALAQSGRRRARPTDPMPRPLGPAGWATVALDPRRGTARLPTGARLDFGGIAKGVFADRLALELRDRFGWPGGCVDAGGDLRSWGCPPDGRVWRVAVEDPERLGEDLLVLAIDPARAGAVATSAPNRRRWGASHHLIDPATGAPVARPPRSVTVLAATLAEAEIVAKSLVVAGRPADLLDAAGAIVVPPDGDIAVARQTVAAGRDEERDAWSIVWPDLAVA